MAFDEPSLEEWSNLPRSKVRWNDLEQIPDRVGRRIASAAKKGQQVEIVYSGGENPQSRRTIRPIEALNISEMIYIRAYCFFRQEERTFRLDRILSARIIDDGSDESEYYCTECGSDVLLTDDICPSCGADISEDENGEENEEDGQGKFTCSECGKSISADATFCRYCGVVFDSVDKDEKDEEAEYVCTECGADVAEDAVICPNCGSDISEIEE